MQDITQLQPVYIDFESYYDRNYSLKRMTTIEYVLDPRWKMLGCSVAIDDAAPSYLSHDEFIAWAGTVDWDRSLLVAHNCLFDGTVLTQRYGHRPRAYACTQAEARALLPGDSSSLANVARLLGVGEKGNALVSGSDVVTQELIDYANNDLYLCREIHKVLYQFFPEKERRLMSMTVRMGVEPTIELDETLLEEVLAATKASREATIAASEVPESVLTSNPRFAALLRSRGIVVPVKISTATGEETEAFAKGDAEFQACMAEYPEHAALFEARLAAKSNIGIKRPEAFIRIASLPSKLPVPYNYFGAHTGRWSGTDTINLQNLPSQRKSKLRRCLRAPKDRVLCVADSSQIELRINLWLSGQMDKLQILRDGGDIYRVDAANFFHIENPADVEDHQRQFGKVRQLGLGFGMGAPKFRYYCAAGPLGMAPIHLTTQESFQAVQGYRAAHPYVAQSWEIMGEMLRVMFSKDTTYQHGPVIFSHEAIELPNGMTLSYPGLAPTESGGWRYGVDKKVKYVYSSLLQENVVQALARIVVADQMLEIDEHYRVVAMTHDEVIAVVPEAEADQGKRLMFEIMSTPPAWAPDLPVSAEVKYDTTYCK